MEYAASISLPIVLVIVSALLLGSRRDLFDGFIKGAGDGLSVSLRIFPSMTALLVGVSMLSASGFTGMVAGLLAPLCERIGIPSETIPLLIIRPLSGSASNAALIDIYDKFGADSFGGIFGSVFFASCETVMYVMAVYFSSVGVKKTRYALFCGFTVMLFCIFATSVVMGLLC